MGCTPSKGQIFARLSSHSDQAMNSGSHENNNSFYDGTEIQSILVPPGDKGFSLCDIQCDTATIIKQSVDVEGARVEGANEDLQEGLLTPQKQENKNNERRQENKGVKMCREKTVHIMSKEDHSETMVRAQHAVFAYLKPNILKYESLFGILDQATQIRLALQPVVTLLALRYEEINCTLEEMAVEGEKMLEKYGNHMTMPPAQRDVSLCLGKHDADLYSVNPPLYLLHQMLQHSTEKMRLIGDSVKGLGDKDLEEASDYFMSLSRLLEDKLSAKRVAEGRVRQVLAQVETAVLRKPSPDDGTVHSEDSGIGADNECQSTCGSMRLYYHRESLGSGTSTGSSSGVPENRPPDQAQFNRVEEGRGDDDDNDNEDDSSNDDDGDKNANKDEDKTEDKQDRKNDVTGSNMSNWSQSQNLSHHPLQVGLQNGRAAIATLERANQRERKIRKPKTADTLVVESQEKHKLSHLMGLWWSQSNDSLYSKVESCIMNEQEKSQKQDKKLKWISKGLAGGMVLSSLDRANLRRHSPGAQSTARSSGLQYGSKGASKASIPVNSPLTLTPAVPGKNAVKQLIDIFSQGVQDKFKHDPFNRPMKIKATKECFVPMLTNIGKGVSINDNNNSYPINQRFSNRSNDIDLDSLPPPPPEVLMDNSSDSKEDPTFDEENGKPLHHECSTERQRCRVSQRLQGSLETVTVIPSQPCFSQGSMSISASHLIREDDMVGGQPRQDCNQQTGVNTNKENAASLYQQSQKIINLQHSSETPDKKRPCDQDSYRLLAMKAGTAAQHGSRELGEGKAARLYLNSYARTIPPVSRVRLPPSQPPVHQRVSSLPASLTPTCHVSEKAGALMTPPVSHMQKCTKRNSEEKIAITPSPSSTSFNDAHSVFCQRTHSGPQSLKPCCSATLPRPWGEPCRGRHQVSHLAPVVMRSSPSGHVTSRMDQQQLLANAKQLHSQDREPITLTRERGDSEPVNEMPGQFEQEIQLTCFAADPLSSQQVLRAQDDEPRPIMD